MLLSNKIISAMHIIHKKMKNLVVLALIVVAGFFFSSCQKSSESVTTVTSENVTYSIEGFYVEQQIVVAGNTVWGISDKVYGTGFQWRDIIALNPFLNTPDRLYYNPDRKMWIVRIYPGEVLNIGGQKVYPSCSYERTTTITTTPIEPAMSLWEWLGIILGLAILAILIISLVSFWRQRYGSSSTAIVHVSILNDIDTDTTRATCAREMALTDRALGVLEQGDYDEFELNSSYLSFAASRREKKETPKNEPVKK